jgi:hypothetical protein
MNDNRPADSFMVLPGMKPRYTTDPSRPGERRLPAMGWMPNRVRHMLVSMIGEFVGTYLFLFFAFAGTQVANSSPSAVDDPASTSTLLYISLAFGFSLAVNVWIFFRISGGLFNPAVSFCFQNAYIANIGLGFGGSGSSWGDKLAQGCFAHHLANSRGHLCRGHHLCPSPRTPCRSHKGEHRHFRHSSAVHRNVPHGVVVLHHLHASGGETQGYISGPNWHWLGLVHCRVGW